VNYSLRIMNALEAAAPGVWERELFLEPGIVYVTD
jgi:hypothetical protein